MNYILSNWFKIIGGEFYFRWVLPTNPSSRNPVIKWAWHGGRLTGDINTRLKFCFVYGGIHVAGLLLGVMAKDLNWSDLPINVYPILTQIHIYTRLKRIKTHRYLPQKIIFLN